ncbi:MAG TPA: hypothetical protein PKM01_04380, partial [Anaerolineaceae bacterium]|nr:hypothetical protein [Anaerolineaceae bacterium]
AAQWLETEGITFADFNCNQILAAEDDFTDAAMNTAALNNITNLVNDPGNDPSNEINGIEVVCVRYGLQRYVDVYTVITTEQEGSFSQLFSNGPINNTVTAVARVIPNTPPAYGGSIVALGACTCEDTGIEVGGNFQLSVTNGGMWANRDIVTTGNSYNVWVRDSDGSILPGSVNCLDDCNITSPRFQPNPVDLCPGDPNKNCPGLVIQPLNIPEPSCGPNRGSFDTASCPNGICQPGTYAGGVVHANLSLMPGAYCITGKVKINADAVLTTVPDANGHNGVTFFVKRYGQFEIQGGTLNLSAPMAPEQVTNGAIQGLLIYYRNGNDSDDKTEIRITGNGTGQLNGMIYSKDNGLYASGTSGYTINGQIIVRWLEFKGTGDLNVNFADYTTWAKPTTLQLQK